MNYTLLHEVTFCALGLTGVAGLVVAIERAIFLALTARETHRHLRQGQAYKGRSGMLPARLLADLAARTTADLPDSVVGNVAQALVIDGSERLRRGLWVIDTVVTAAPLLGLLGTIFGIIDTFTALARSGVSDPQAVSAGIGTALVATATGIGVAVVGLVCNNYFQDRVESVGDLLKRAVLEVLAERGGAIHPSDHDGMPSHRKVSVSSSPLPSSSTARA